MEQPSAGSGVISRHILLSDIVGSSRLHEEYSREYDAALDRHNELTEQTVADCGGEIFKSTGDGYYAFFDSAEECISCAIELARQFAKFPDFAKDDPFLVRIIAHQGEMRPAGTEFFGPALNRASRLCQVCHPRQVILSEPAKPRDLPEGATLIDLGQHHLRDLAEPEHLYQLDIPGLTQEFPALPTLGNRPNNLVEQPSAFIGREQELAYLKTMLLDSRRLVTITAPGGYGKSRLAAHLCADLLTAFERGVFFVELAPLRDHTGITTALANATGFQFYGSRDPREQLIDYLREKEILLCFDNFEHVLEGASFIGDILKEAPKVKIVVTSREPLRITGEQLYPLEPLPVDRLAPEDEGQADAVLLFADRATLVDATFTPDDKSLAGVQTICQKLDGVPLAIELAAAWMDTYTLNELRDELDRQLELVARLSDVHTRHRSLRASLDWSWNLLGEEQRRMLMQLSTFRGGCFGEAASAVLGVRSPILRQELAKLVDKSWLFTRDVDGHMRFFMRDVASHEYAFEKLEETRADSASSLYEQAVMAHARYFSGLMEREGQRLHGHGQLEALRITGQEIQNIYEALDTLLNRLRQEDAIGELAGLLLPVARWLWRFLEMTSAFRELVERYQALKDAAGQADGQLHTLLWALLGCGRGQLMSSNFDAARSDANRGGALAETLGDPLGVAHSILSMGLAERRQGNYDTAGELLAESLAMFREIDDRAGIEFSLNDLGVVEWCQGNYDAARKLYAESLTIRREIGDRYGIATSLNNLGIVEYSQGNYDAARKLYAESLTIRREISDRYGIASCNVNLGATEYYQGNYDAAQELWTESLAIFREIGERFGIASSLNNLGNAIYTQGNYDSAWELLAESLAIGREIGDRRTIATSLNTQGSVEYSRGNYDAARKLYAESLTIRREIGDRYGTAEILNCLGLAEYNQGNYDAARELYAESLAIRREIGDPKGICDTIAAIGMLAATASQGQAGAICMSGALYHAAQLGFTFSQEQGELLDQGLATVEHHDSGLPSAERERLKARAEAMSLDELAEYALEALKKLELA